MKYDPKIHHRRSIRLKGYDYSQAGAYFITICCQDRACLFGKIIEDTDNVPTIELNEYGAIAYNEWNKLTERFPNLELDVFQIMPNHIHAIIVLTDREQDIENRKIEDGANVKIADVDEATARVARTVGDIVGAYKSLVNNKCLAICKANNEYLGKLWQRNYYEHIIRDEGAYRLIADYIITNPAHWQSDKFYTS
jgi:putative transposase